MSENKMPSKSTAPTETHGKKPIIRPLTLIITCALIALLIFSSILLIEYTQLNGANSEFSKLNSAETVFLEPLNWQFERFDAYRGYHFDLPSAVNSSYYGSYFDAGTISESVLNFEPFEGYLFFTMNITADLSQGFVKDINVVTFNSFPSSHFSFGYDLNPTGEGFKVMENLTESMTGSNSLILADGVNHPRRVSMKLSPHLSLSSPDNQTEFATVYVEVTYFNGTSYKKAVRPFNLTLIAYNNTSFESAEELETNGTTITRIGRNGRYGPKDFYKIHLGTGETANVTMTPAYRTLDFALYVYSSENLSSPLYDGWNSLAMSAGTENFAFTADHSGWWYVKVQAYGIYSLDCVTLSP